MNRIYILVLVFFSSFCFGQTLLNSSDDYRENLEIFIPNKGLVNLGAELIEEIEELLNQQEITDITIQPSDTSLFICKYTVSAIFSSTYFDDKIEITNYLDSTQHNAVPTIYNGSISIAKTDSEIKLSQLKLSNNPFYPESYFKTYIISDDLIIVESNFRQEGGMTYWNRQNVSFFVRKK